MGFSGFVEKVLVIFIENLSLIYDSVILDLLTMLTLRT